MSLQFSDDDKMIQEQVDRLLSSAGDMAEVRRVLDEEKRYSDELWDGLAQLGVLGINIPEEYGGVATGYKSLCLVAQSLGKFAAAVPFAASVALATEALVLFGSDEQKQAHLPSMAEGTRIGTIAVTESTEQLTASNLECMATDGAITGTKLAVAAGGIAHFAIVIAQSDKGPSLFIVDLEETGVERSDVPTIDPTMNTATIDFCGAKAQLLGQAGKGWEQLKAIYDRAAILLAFEQVGGAQAALDMAVEYAKGRYAFGRPIGSFQALKHMMADMYTSLRLAESNAFAGAEALAEEADDLPLTAAVARVSSIKAYQLCTKDNIQIHGGMGFTWEFDCHVYYRRSNYQTLLLEGLSVWEGRLKEALLEHGGKDSQSDIHDANEEDRAFRAEVRSWIKDNGPKHLKPYLETSLFGSINTGPEDRVQAAKDWQRKKAEGGWATLMWPKQYGGRDASPIQNVIWNQEEGIYGLLTWTYIITHGMCGPTVMAYANDEQKRKLLPKMANGEELWCQLFSEPAAGSDLAGLRTKAVKDGDEWVINGQKIWTSSAHFSDYGILLTRTDPNVAKHAGLTMFFVDMKTPGIDIRPIKQINRGTSFNEVYFENVRIPDANRLGDVGEGWKVALTTLMNERMAIGGSVRTGVPELVELVQSLVLDNEKACERADVQARLADYYAKAAGLKNAGIRSIALLADGGTPGPENSIGKLVVGEMMQDLTKFAMDLQGFGAVIDDPTYSEGEGRFQAMLMRSPALRIEGGSDQILRNIISERVLGLPAEMRADKGLTFNEVPTGSG